MTRRFDQDLAGRIETERAQAVTGEPAVAAEPKRRHHPDERIRQPVARFAFRGNGG